MLDLIADNKTSEALEGVALGEFSTAVKAALKELPSGPRKALDLALTEDVKLSELPRMLFTALWRLPVRPIVLDWIRAHWDAIRAKLPGNKSGGLAHIVAATCTQTDRDDWMKFLTEKLDGVEGHERPLQESLEESALCVALRRQSSPAVAEYLAKAH